MRLRKQSVEFVGECSVNAAKMDAQLAACRKLVQGKDADTESSSNYDLLLDISKILDHTNIVVSLSILDADKFRSDIQRISRHIITPKISKSGDTVYLNGSVTSWINTLVALTKTTTKYDLDFRLMGVLANNYPKLFTSSFPKYIDKVESKSLDIDVIKSQHLIPQKLKAFSFLWVCNMNTALEMLKRCDSCKILQSSARHNESEIVNIIPLKLKSFKEGEYLLDREGRLVIDNVLISKDHFCSMNELHWIHSAIQTEQTYLNLIQSKENLEGWHHSYAKSVLPASLSTELYITADLKGWKRLFNMMCNIEQPQLVAQVKDTLRMLDKEIPNYFTAEVTKFLLESSH